MSVWPIATWLMVVASAGAVGAGVYGEVLAGSLVLDLVSFWPGLVVAFLLATAVWPLRRRGVARVAAILPLLLLTWGWGAVALHLAEWELLPSASADLAGPPVEQVGRAELSLEGSGRLTLQSDGGLLYSVLPERRGGDAGIPEAVERIDDGQAVVRVVEGDPGRWFGTAGWRLVLAAGPNWVLDLTSAEVELDLRSLLLSGLRVVGTGEVSLPPVDAEVPVRLGGRLTVSIPPGTGTEVTGPASVPTGWEVTDTGWRSPTRRPGYVVTVTQGAQVTLLER